MSTLITAQSGCEQTPENSIEYLQTAFQIPVDCLEVDVRRRADGELMLGNHDIHTDSPPLSRAFERLSDYPHIKLNCDLREPNLEFSVLELAKRYGVQGQLIYSGLVNLHLLERNPLLRQSVEIYLNLELLMPLLEKSLQNGSFNISRAISTMIRGAKKAAQYHVTCLNLYYQLCVPQFTEALARINMPFSAWTPDAEQEIRALCEMGAYNITTRRPIEALRIRDEVAAGRNDKTAG